MPEKGRVLVAMSGGIDSSIAALLLREEGYEVIGVTMKTWDYSSSGGSRKETGCCSLDSINDARQVAVDHNFPHYILDLREEFGEAIINDFVNEYMAGRTPNPCVLCNTYVKWDALLRRADRMGCAYIATGHYAKIRRENGRYVISRGNDHTKDQSYVLWGVSQKSLSRTIFPLGGIYKKEVREIALKYGYENLAKKRESYEICFIPDNDYRSFLKRKAGEFNGKKIREGVFVSTDGRKLGTHGGYPFFTIGQRRGLGMAAGEPMYVVDIYPETNTIVLGDKDDLLGTEMLVEKPNLIKYRSLNGGMELMTRIRYRHGGAMSSVVSENGHIRVKFYEQVSAITPGQSAVFYEGDDIVGGGIIKRSLKS